jgi:small acid-soluble spore protein I (minor)
LNGFNMLQVCAPLVFFLIISQKKYIIKPNIEIILKKYRINKECVMMNLNLRNAIIHNVAGNSQDELEDTIVDAIQNGEEKMLPGLGVLFEVIWKNSSEEEKKEMLATLENGLK